MELLSYPRPTSSSTCHLLAIPYPGRGHINPMMNLCKIILSRAPDLMRVSFLVTEEWAGLLGVDKSKRPGNLRFVTIPNVLPSELVRGSNLAEFFEAVSTKMEAPVERILDCLVDYPPTLIVSDSFLPWAIPLANRRNIPVASLFPMSAAVLSVLKGLSDSTPPDHIPSTNATSSPIILKRLTEAMSRLPKAQYLLVSTVYELESQLIDTLRGELSLPIYIVGPILNYSELENSCSAASPQGETDYFGWLDRKPHRSVLFVSLGSYLHVSNEQMDELGAGLCEARVPFLWVVRGENHRLQETCGELGLIVPWCDQLRVLCHPAIGGFLSHCGWNSAQEGIYAAVPFITFPLVADQFLNSKLIVEDWKIGYAAKKTEAEAALVVTRQQISGLVKKLMDCDCEEGKQMRVRVRRFQGFFHKAVTQCGSTASDVSSFISNAVSKQ